MFHSLNRITRKQHAVIQVAHTAALPGTFWFQLTLFIYIFITSGSAGTTDHGGHVVLARLHDYSLYTLFGAKHFGGDQVIFLFSWNLKKPCKVSKVSNLVWLQYKSDTSPIQLYLNEITRPYVISCNLAPPTVQPNTPSTTRHSPYNPTLPVQPDTLRIKWPRRNPTPSV